MKTAFYFCICLPKIEKNNFINYHTIVENNDLLKILIIVLMFCQQLTIKELLNSSVILEVDLCRLLK